MILWDRPPLGLAPLAAEVQAELCIVGGGFLGLSTALHAAEAGVRVVLLEAHRIAHGASGRNAGFVVPNFAKVPAETLTGTRLLRMAAGSADLVFSLVARHGIEGARQGGWLNPSHSESALARARAQVAAWGALGRPVEELTAPQIEALTGLGGWLGGWIDRSGGVLDPVAYAQGLARAASHAGAACHEETPALTLTPEGAGWRVGTPSGAVHATRVLLATNAHAGALVPGLAQSVIPLRVFQVASEPVATAFPQGLALSDSRRNLFTLRRAGDRLITGGMHVLPFPDRRVPARILARLSRAIGQRLTLSHAWSGWAAVTPDFLPRVIEPAPGLLAAFACNGRGVAMTTAAGVELAAWAAGRPSDDLALPRQTLKPLPLPALARLAPNALLPWSMLRDRLEAAPPHPL